MVMERRLYGLDALLDGLVPQLVGRARNGDVCELAHRAGNPAVEVVGGRDTGKSALLEVLFESYKDLTPLARVDFADSRYGEPGLAEGIHEQETPNASPVSNLLYLLSHKLGLKIGTFHRPVRFPRLHLGLLIVTAWCPDGEGISPPDLRQKQESLRQLIAQAPPDPRRLRTLLDQWAGAVISNAGAVLPGLPGIDAIITGTLQTARDQLLTRPDKGSLRWWGDHLPSFHGNGLQRLFDSVWDFRRDGPSRREAEGRLVAAFLDDIAQHYDASRKWYKAPRPLLLFDNVHAGAGGGFWELLCSAYGMGAGGAERPAVVATSLGRGQDHAPPRDYAQRQGPRVRLGIPEVAVADVRSMLNATPDYGKALPTLIERFSGGRTGSAVVLADEAVRLRRTGGEHADPWSLIDAAAPRLLASLVPDPELHEALMFHSAAGDRATAERLWRAFHPDDDGAAQMEQALDHLAAAGLTDDAALRDLLLHRLAGDPRWGRIHLNLRAGRNPNQLEEYAPGHSDGYLRHTLALSRIEPVAQAMHRRLAATPPGEWLTSLNRLCSAPRPHPDPVLEPDESAPRCPACPGDAKPDDVHLAVRRLLKHVWDLSAPLCCEPPERVLEWIGSDLENLHRAVRSEDITYRLAAHDWPKQLKNHVRAPRLRVPEAIG
jgi:hypothetical protein